MTPARTVPAAALLAASFAIAVQAQVEAPTDADMPPRTVDAAAQPAGTTDAGGATGGQPRGMFSQQPPFSLGAGYIHQFTANTGGTGSMSADRLYASFSSRLVTQQDWSLTIAMGYEADMYHWSGLSPLGTRSPWDTVNLFGLQLRGSFKVADDWVATFGGIFALAGEADADAGDSIYGGGIGSIAWAPSREMLLGIGVLGVTQIENQPIVIPIPVIHWNFAPEWELSTIRRPPASPFVGVDVAWEPEGSKLDVALGIGWQQRRFRLASNADPLLNNGVGLDQTWAAFASAGYDIVDGLRLDLVVGLTFYEKLQLEDSSGGSLRETTVDPSALLGAFVTWSF